MLILFIINSFLPNHISGVTDNCLETLFLLELVILQECVNMLQLLQGFADLIIFL